MTASDRDYVAHYFDESLRAMTEFTADPATRNTLFVMAEAVCAAMRQGGKLLLAGNGGSAADAQHIAAEFTGRLMYDRPPLAAIALTTDTSALTAISNDYGYEQVFGRQVRALGRPGDVFLGITTSGRSPNILRALEAARGLGLVTLGFAGRDDTTMRGLCDALLLVPAERASIVQQVHISAAHVLCALVERHFFPTPPNA